MSYQVVQWVRQHSPTKGASRSVLVVLAEHARRDGTSSHPSVPTIAAEIPCARRTVQYALRALEQAGCIEKTGLRRTGTVVWSVLMTETAKTAEVRSRPKPRYAPLGAHLTTPRGAPVPPEPSEKGQGTVPIDGGGRRNGAGARRAQGLVALRDAGRHLSQHPALVGGGA